jgi:hypothetical protein
VADKQANPSKEAEKPAEGVTSKPDTTKVDTQAQEDAAKERKKTGGYQ